MTKTKSTLKRPPAIGMLIAWYNESKKVTNNHNYSAEEILAGVKKILAVRNSPHFTDQSCYMLFTMIANFGLLYRHIDNETLDLLQHALTLKAPELDSQGIANTLNAVAKLGWQLDALKPALLTAVQRNAAEFNAQGIANTLNAVAKLGWQLDALKPSLLTAVQRNAADFNAQNIANTLNAVAKLGWQLDALKPALLSAVQSNAANFNAQEIANTLNALAKFGWQLDALKPALLSAAQRNAANFNAQEIANTLNAVAKLGWQIDALKLSLLTAVQRNAADFNAQDIANTLNAVAKLGWQLDALKPSLLAAVQRNAADFNAQEIANTLNAIAKLGWQLDALEPSLLASVQRNAAEFNAQEIANTLNAVAKLGILSKDLLIMSLIILAKNKEEILDDALWCHQTYEALVYFCINDQNKWQIIKNELTKIGLSLDIIKQKSEEQLRENVVDSTSNLQTNVKSILASLVPSDLFEEHILYCHIVDLFVPSLNLVIEVDGPLHYLMDGSLNLDSKRKQDSLRNLGYKVERLKYSDWGKLSTNQDKLNFLAKLLAKYKPQSVNSDLNPAAREFMPSFKRHGADPVNRQATNDTHTTHRFAPPR